jgi:hypothetical protein
LRQRQLLPCSFMQPRRCGMPFRTSGEGSEIRSRHGRI